MAKSIIRLLVFSGCFLLSIGANAFVIAPSSIGPLFRGHFGMTETAIGIVISAPFIGMALTQIPSGYLLDRVDNRWIVTTSVILYATIILIVQYINSVTHFLILRVFGGIVIGIIFSTGANIIGTVFSPQQQDLATGAYLSSLPVSWVIAHTTSPLIGISYGPRRVFLLHGALAVAGLTLLWLGTTGPIRSAGTPRPAEIMQALGNRSVLLVALSGGTASALYVFLNTWIPTYGRDVLTLPLSAAGFATALVPLVGIIARTGGGWLSSFLEEKRLLVIGGGLLIGLTFTIMIPFAEGFVLFLVLLGSAAFAVQLGAGVFFVLVRTLSTPGTEGTSLTILTTATTTGSLIAPLVGGWLIEGHSWPTVFSVFAITGLMGVVVLLPLLRPSSERNISA